MKLKLITCMFIVYSQHFWSQFGGLFVQFYPKQRKNDTTFAQDETPKTFLIKIPMKSVNLGFFNKFFSSTRLRRIISATYDSRL